MKTPQRQTYAYPGRYVVFDEPYQVDWSSLMEDGETVVTSDAEMVRGDTIVGRITTIANVTTFWLSGGSTGIQVQQVRVSCSTSSGETEAILATFSVLG